MRYECGACGFTEAVDDVHHSRRQAYFLKIICEFERRQRGLFGWFEHAAAAGGNRWCELPRGHEQWIVPRNNLRGDPDRFAQREAERVGRDRVHVAGDFRRESTVILE